jgi:acetyl/propionyl-CoA carboxylase alpha subunit/acetyl-CoA carboxylase carboxyltransferase component
MQRAFSRLAIINRGEPAMRVIHAVRELNQQHPEQIRLIALYTEAERDAMFVREADEALCLGPSTIDDGHAIDDGHGARRVGPTTIDDGHGARRVGPSTIDDGHGARLSPYLDHAALERALTATRADAAWVGWGFVAKQLAEEAGVAVAPWSGGPVATVEEALGHAERIGFPLMVKAAAGAAGRAIRRVNHADALAAAFASARAEALHVFGDGTLLLEQLVTDARQIEVQIIADGQGGAWPVGVRDCSYQRRNQKVIEESASPALTPDQERELMDAAKRLTLRAGYRNAGTVEFLYEPSEHRFSFMEVNPRLQAEHPVTEAVTGLDLVKLALHVAAGGVLIGHPPTPVGHAIEARLNAEDPALGFAPSPGRLALLRLPTGPGIRVDTGIAEGDVIPAEFDSMIGKLVAWGRDRGEALARLRRAVTDTVVVIDGGTTNQGFLLELLDRPEVRTGEVDTTWLDRLYSSGEAVPSRHADIALLQAAIELADEDLAEDRSRFYAFARQGRPQAEAGLARSYELRHRGWPYQLSVSQIGPVQYRVTVDGCAIELITHRLGAHERRLILGDDTYRTVTSRQGEDLLIEVSGVPHRISRDDGGIVYNLSPAVVVSLPVAVGDVVEAGDVVAVVEAMKMESSLTAPLRGRVKQLLVGENTHVAAHAPLLSIEPLDGEVAHAAGERLSFAARVPASESVAPERCHENLRRMGWLVLGYDIGRAEVQRTIADLHGQCADLLACDPALVPGEHRLLGMFADLQALARPRHSEDDSEASLLRSPEEHLHAWLRSLDAEVEGLPPRFVEQLRSALSHYGIESLERTPALQAACHRLFLGQRRAGVAREAILAILDRRLEQADQLAGYVGEDFREVLDRLVLALEGRDPMAADLAREVRFRYFDGRVIAVARESVYAEMEQHVTALTSDPQRPDRAELIEEIVDCTRPLSTLLTTSMQAASPPSRHVLLEAMARRYYRLPSLEGFEDLHVDGHTFVLGRYEFEGRLRHIAAAYVELEDLESAVAAFGRHCATLPDGELAVLDLYAAHGEPAPTHAEGAPTDGEGAPTDGEGAPTDGEGAPTDGEGAPTDGEGAPTHAEFAEQLRETLARIPTTPALHRIVVAVAEPRRGRGMSAIDLFTFRPGPEGLREDEVLRGLHPMMGQRLQLWRLSEFELERVPSAEDIYAFRGVARTNPKDERLFAIAEVRDLTRVYDERGHVVALPELEQVLVRVLETIRSFQTRRPLNRRLMWNRVLLHVWPVMEPDPEEIRALIERLAPLTTGLGIELLAFQGRVREPDGTARRRVLRFFVPTGHDVAVEVADPPKQPVRPLDESARRMISARRRGTLHPVEIVRLLAPAKTSAGQPGGAFVEHELGEDGRLAPVDRPPAMNPSGIVVGTIRNFSERYPEGMLRVILLGDPTRSLGSLAEPECRRINAAIDLAEELGVPLEWFALSAGAKIAMDSGTETMDWIADVLRRIILFTQAGGEINIVVAGINVGAQPYFNAEATMLMHTRGVLIMTPDSAMVLTGKQALDYSGGVSAEDNFGIGGYERIMGPNGQAQYWARDLAGACHVLLSYYEHAYVAPGERFPRPALTTDPPGRDIGDAEHLASGSPLHRVADVFSDATNPGRKKPFDIRSVMRAVVDCDHQPLERWAAMDGAEIAVVWDAHLGGWPVAMIGMESHPLPRHGPLPADGPDQWTSGTLFPRSAKKIARTINSAAGRRPLVVLANLAGFDGSPESMRGTQLEFGAEIGRAVVNYDGPIVFCVVSRFHGGAFVVFSHKLNPNLEIVALEGSRASVIGGAPAAGVVFVRDVEHAALADPRIASLDASIAAAQGAERQRLRAERANLWTDVLSHSRREYADRFDATHSVERAVAVGSVSQIITSASMRGFLIEAVQRGMRRTLESSPATGTETGTNGDQRARPAKSTSP